VAQTDAIKAMKFEGLSHVFCQCDKCKAEKQEPKREWVPLTDDQIKEIIGPYAGPIKGYTRALFDKIDAKLRENNA